MADGQAPKAAGDLRFGRRLWGRLCHNPRRLAFALIVVAASILSGWFLAQRACRPEINERIIVGWTDLAYDLPYFVAINERVFEDHLLHPEAKFFADSNTMAEALAQGDIDVATSVSTHALLAVESAVPARVRVIGVHLSSKDQPGDFALAPLSSPLSGIPDLASHTVGVHPGSTMRVYAEAALQKHGVDPKTVRFVQVPPHQQRAAIANKTVDALFAYDPWATEMIRSGTTKTLMVAPKNVIADPLPSGAYAVSRDLAMNRPKTARKVRDVFNDTFLLIKSEPHAARKTVLRFLKGISPETLAQMKWVTYALYDKSQIRPLQKYADYLVRVGAIAAHVDAGNLLLE